MTARTPNKPTAIPIKKLDWESLIPRIWHSTRMVCHAWRTDGLKDLVGAIPIAKRIGTTKVAGSNPGGRLKDLVGATGFEPATSTTPR